LEEVEKRDPKGLYAKARAGIIKGAFRLSDFSSSFLPLTSCSSLLTASLLVPLAGISLSDSLLTHALTDFTGISAPYEAPEKPELHIKTNEVDIAGGVAIIVKYLEDNKFI
jgi:adenylylsulfate kinase